MDKITDLYANKGSRPLIAVDFSPPRSGDPAFAEAARTLDADLVCVAYSPGRSVRMDSVAAAATINRDAGKDVIFNLSPRDMNKLALQMHLLGAQALGLKNVLVLKGDEFSEKDLARLQSVDDYQPTELVAAIKEMNQGVDFKGLKLAAPTDFCVGATADFSKGIESEARLAVRKTVAGADFLVTQSVYDPAHVAEFARQYQAAAGHPLGIPVLYGVQVLVQGGLVFGNVPDSMRNDLESGRPGPEIAVELLHSLMDAGCDAFYVIPPILKGGARDYEAAQEVLAALRG